MQSSALVGASSAQGTLCVRIYDVGTLTDSVDYSIEVKHP